MRTAMDPVVPFTVWASSVPWYITSLLPQVCWLECLGFLKALVWPAFLVYGVLKFLGM